MDSPKPAPPEPSSPVRRFLHLRATSRRAWWLSKAVYAAIESFLMEDGLYMASALAFSLLLAIFPFVIFLTALTGFLGGEELSAWLTKELFEAFPDQVAATLQPEVERVVRDAGGGLLTFGLAVTLISVSSAVETVRGGLNRAYRLTENRSVVRTRIESIAFVIVGTIVLVFVAFVAVVLPIAYRALALQTPDFPIPPAVFAIVREAVLAVVLGALLYALHRLLPCHGRPRPALWPGILVTLALWGLGGRAFSWYLGSFADYARIYAGLAGIVAALIFFYVAAAILLFAGSFNRAIDDARVRRRTAPDPDA